MNHHKQQRNLQHEFNLTLYYYKHEITLYSIIIYVKLHYNINIKIT